MSTPIYIHGIGAVSPAGWGVGPLRDAMTRSEPLATRERARPGLEKPQRVRPVPPPVPRPAFLASPRLRRTSPITQFAVAAALEAVGADAAKISAGTTRLGVILCTMSGCVNYSRRFFDETLRDPATASPLVFPETVFNAPASHLAALLGTTAINYTLVGDPGTFLQGIALAADWLTHELVDGCLVVSAEEIDWLIAEALRLFSHRLVLSEGAGAVYLRREPPAENPVRLEAVTDSFLFSARQTRARAAMLAHAQLPPAPAGALLCDGRQNIPRVDAAETAAWLDWPGARLSPKKILGESLTAAAAWQTVLALDALRHHRHPSAVVSVVGCNQQAIAAQFGCGVTP